MALIPFTIRVILGMVSIVDALLVYTMWKEQSVQPAK